jgi:hypothetical protein
LNDKICFRSDAESMEQLDIESGMLDRKSAAKSRCSSFAALAAAIPF